MQSIKNDPDAGGLFLLVAGMISSRSGSEARALTCALLGDHRLHHAPDLSGDVGKSIDPNHQYDEHRGDPSRPIKVFDEYNAALAAKKSTVNKPVGRINFSTVGTILFEAIVSGLLWLFRAIGQRHPVLRLHRSENDSVSAIRCRQFLSALWRSAASATSDTDIFWDWSASWRGLWDGRSQPS